MAVKKTQAQDKAVTTEAPTTPGMVTVTVAVGPIHHGGKRYAPGDTLELTEATAAALVSAGLVTEAKRG